MVAGCRPVELATFVPETAWVVLYPHRLVSFGVPSEVLVAALR